MLLQIAEPDAPVEDARPRRLGLGIDLGTTNSLIAHSDGKNPFDSRRLGWNALALRGELFG